MKLKLFALFTIFLWTSVPSKASQPDSLKLAIFEDVIYFDGYAALVPLTVKEGLFRSNTSYTRQLSSTEIATLTKGTVKMQVNLKAACVR
jgi:hypothetical protein